MSSPVEVEDEFIVESRSGWRRRANEIAISVAVAAVVGYLVYALATSPNISWSVVGDSMFDPQIMQGLKVTLYLAAISCLFATVLGTVLGVMRLSSVSVVRWVADLYVWFFRGTPLLVQIIFWYNIALFVPRVKIFGYEQDTNALVSQFTAAVVALSTNAAAYVCEVIRGGILSVDRGQTDAAAVIGLTPRQATYRIVLPQAIRVMIPPYMNLTIDLLKATALVSVIGTQDLLTSAQTLSQTNYKVIELLCVVSVWFLFLVTVLSAIQGRVEHRLARVTGSRVERRSLFRRVASFRTSPTSPTSTSGVPHV